MKPNVQLAASIEFLKTDLLGALQSIGDKQTLLVKQLNAGEKSNGISLKELGAALTKAIGGEEIKLPTELNDLAKEYKVFIKQVYLKIERTPDKTDYEYALWLSINLDKKGLDELKTKNPIFEVVALKEVALKVWNTKNAKILEEMNFVDIKEQLSLTA